MAGPNEIGKAKIVVEADVDQAKADLQGVKSDIQDVGDEAVVAGSKMEGGFSKAGSAIENSTEGVRKFAGALGSTVGIASQMVGVFAVLSGAVLGLKAVLDKLSSPGGGLSESNKIMSQMADEARGLNAALAESSGLRELAEKSAEIEQTLVKMLGGLSGLAEFDYDKLAETRGRAFADTVVKLKGELQKLREEQAALLKTINDAESKRADIARAAATALSDQTAAIKEQEAALKSLQSLTEGAAISLLEPDEQVRARAERQIRAINELAEKSGNGFLGAISIGLVEEAAARQLELIKENADKEAKLKSDKAAAQHKKNLEMIDREVEQFTRGIDGVFGANSDFVNTLEAMVVSIKRIDNSVGSLPK